jgi:predicted nucleotidyltransferase
MNKHHEEAIERLIAHFRKDAHVEAVLLGGSIARGWETGGSDIDVMLLVSEDRYRELAERRAISVYAPELCDYPGGYVEGKYVDRRFMEQVAEKGSEPARFAFQGARVLYSRTGPLDGLLERIVRYPSEGLEERVNRFYAQLEAWNWYSGEAIKRGSDYLLWLSIGKLVLFGGRLILAHNRLLYPYHKWFLTVLAGAKEKPDGLMNGIERLYRAPDSDGVRGLFECVRDFRNWGTDQSGWVPRFMKDSELTWQDGCASVDDL